MSDEISARLAFRVFCRAAAPQGEQPVGTTARRLGVPYLLEDQQRNGDRIRVAVPTAREQRVVAGGEACGRPGGAVRHRVADRLAT
jgi:hypothetical protein